MKNNIFAGLLIVAGAILLATAEISNGSVGVFVGIPLICWGVLERFIPILKEIFKKDK